jgi:hypothetical protein
MNFKSLQYQFKVLYCYKKILIQKDHVIHVTRRRVDCATLDDEDGEDERNKLNKGYTKNPEVAGKFFYIINQLLLIN